MADQMGPGEEGHEGFKIFGMSVNQFSAAVAGFDAFNRALAKNAAEQKESESDIAEKHEKAAEKQSDAADAQKDASKAAKDALGSQGGMFDSLGNAFSNIGDSVREALMGAFGALKGVIMSLIDVIKSFAARFIIVFTAVNILTRVLEELIGRRARNSRFRYHFYT